MGRCKRHGCESARGESRECRGRAAVAGAYGKRWAQKRQVTTYVCLEGAGNRGENVEKQRSQGRERAVKRGENVEKTTASQGRAGGMKEKTDMGG